MCTFYAYIVRIDVIKYAILHRPFIRAIRSRGISISSNESFSLSFSLSLYLYRFYTQDIFNDVCVLNALPPVRGEMQRGKLLQSFFRAGFIEYEEFAGKRARRRSALMYSVANALVRNFFFFYKDAFTTHVQYGTITHSYQVIRVKVVAL